MKKKTITKKTSTKTKLQRKIKVSSWQHIGQVCVDSGAIYLGDPCYMSKVCEDGNKDMGVFIMSGFGDGIYNVEAKTIDIEGLGRITKEVRVIFITDDFASGDSDLI